MIFEMNVTNIYRRCAVLLLRSKPDKIMYQWPIKAITAQ